MGQKESDPRWMHCRTRIISEASRVGMDFKTFPTIFLKNMSRVSNAKSKHMGQAQASRGELAQCALDLGFG